MSFASICVFTYAYPVSFLSKNHKKVLAVRKSYRKEVVALLSCNRKEVLAVSRTQAQVIRNQPQEELLLADTKRSSCVCIIFGLCCIFLLVKIGCKETPIFELRSCSCLLVLSAAFWLMKGIENITVGVVSLFLSASLCTLSTVNQFITNVATDNALSDADRNNNNFDISINDINLENGV